MTDGVSAKRFKPSRSGPARPTEVAEVSGLRRLSMLLLAGLGALTLGYLVLRVSVVNALLSLGPEAAAMVSPNHPEVLLDRAFDELRLGGEPSDEAKRHALGAFRSAPLSEVPLLIGAHEATARNDATAAERLVAAAIRRNPRSRYALLQQLYHQIQRGQIREVASTMAVLTRLLPGANDLLIAALARMASDPRSRTAVKQIMETDQQIRTNVLEQLAREGTDPDTMLNLAGSPGSGASSDETPRWQRLMLDGLVERGEVAQAFRAWLRLGGAPTSSVNGIYDPDFAGRPGAPPFNWSLESGADGFAEGLGDSGGLQAEYYGQRPARLASQLLVLGPGSYQMSFEVEGRADGEDTRLSWVVSCHPGNRVLAELPISGVDYATKRISRSFIVPQTGCSGQWLRLGGSSAEFPKEQRVTIRQLRIARVGQQ